MEEIKYEVTANHLCKTQCPFNELSEWKKVGAFECTEQCPAFVSNDREARVVVCNPEKVPYARFVWSEKMMEKYPDLGRNKNVEP